MKSPISHPTLYQINTRAWITRRSQELGRTATLDDIPDSDLDELAARGFDWVYMLGVWQPSERAREIALVQDWLQREARMILPDLTPSDICGSCFAIQDYRISPALGGEAALQRFRQRLHQRDIRIMLDFVPNHTAIDHPWAYEHPDYFIAGSPQDLERHPDDYVEVESISGKHILAHGRDPYFPAWIDTLQLNYANPALHAAMIHTLLRIAAHCDGVRCDMAMLLLPGIIERVWGLRAEPFWAPAIELVRKAFPKFVFMAEVYWGLEWNLLQQGFDYAYGKELYDRLRNLHAHPVRDHLQTEPAYIRKLVIFLENHDEQRAASVFTEHIHPAAAVIAYLTPGLRFFHQGQLDGFLERVPVQLCRAPEQRVNGYLKHFYLRLLECLKDPVFHTGRWRLIEALPAEGGSNWEDIIAWGWSGPGEQLCLVVVNYSHQPGRCFLRAPYDWLRGRRWQLEDQMGETRLETSGDDLVHPGIALTLPEWGYYVFKLQPLQ